MRYTKRVILSALTTSLLASMPAWAGDDEHPRRGLSIGGDCENCDFSEKNLAGAIFIGANFQGSTFADSELPGVTIVESRFNVTDFSDAQMTGARLTGVTFSRSVLDLSLIHI